MKIIELKINNSVDRERMILALANSGYEVKVSERKDKALIIGNDYYVQFKLSDKKTSSSNGGLKVPKVHELKTWPEFFEAVWNGEKPFEVRKNDRDYRIGDTLLLKEYSSESGYTGREIDLTVTYILDHPEFVKDGYVVIGLE